MESPYLRFQTPELQAQWLTGSRPDIPGVTIHPALYIVVSFAALLYCRLTNQPLIITSLIRKPDPNLIESGVHFTGQGADAHVELTAKADQAALENQINAAILYLSGRKELHTALIHEVEDKKGNKLGLHLHLQVGPLEPKPATPETFIV